MKRKKFIEDFFFHAVCDAAMEPNSALCSLPAGELVRISAAISRRFNSIFPDIRICPCGNIFKVGYGNIKYCSDECLKYFTDNNYQRVTLSGTK